MMDIQVGLSKETVRLRHAILLYESSRGLDAATYHDVSNTFCERWKIMPGRPLDINTVLAMFESLAKGKARPDQLRRVPEGVLAFSAKRLIFTIPAGRHVIHFKTGKELDRHDGKKVWLPRLVFDVADGMHVYAVKDTELTDKTPLYCGPFLNTAENGSVCLGSASRPPLEIDAAPKWAEFFFDTPFSHAGGSSMKYKGGAMKFWAALMSGEIQGERIYRHLRPAGKRLAELLTR